MAAFDMGLGFLWQGAAASRGMFVKAGTVAQSATLCTAITDVVIGVLQENITANDAATGKLIAPLWLPGSISRVIANTAITKGVKVGPATSAKAQPAVTTQFPCGIAMTAAAALGDEIDVMLFAGAVVI